MKKKYVLFLLLFASGTQINAMSMVRSLWNKTRLKFKLFNLNDAIMRGDCDEVKRLLEQDERFIHHCSLHTVLDLAGKYRYCNNKQDAYLQIAQLLIQKGVDVHEQDKRGNTPLCRVLFPYCVDHYEYRDGHHERDIDYYILNNKMHILGQLILKKGNINLNESGEEYMTRAINKRKSRVIEFLVKNGVRVNRYSDGVEDTYVWKILKDRHCNLVSAILLVKHGANVYVSDQQGQTYLSFVLNKIGRLEDEERVHFLDHFEFARLLVTKDADINTKDRNGNTLLMLAILNEGLEKVLSIPLLIKKGANVNEKNNVGDTPLILASRCEYSGGVDILIKNGADMNLKNDEGNTPLILASYYGYSEIADILIKNGAQVNKRDSDGSTPLTIALRNGSSRCAQLLLKSGGCVSVEKNLSEKPESLVRLSKKEEVFQLLWQQSHLLKNSVPLYWIRNLQPNQIVNKQAKEIAKYWLGLQIPQLVLVIKRLELKKNQSQIDQLLLKKLESDLAKKRGFFKKFVFFNAFAQGDMSFILTTPALKDVLVGGVSNIVGKITLLTRAAEQDDIRKVCQLLQTNHLFTETLEAILIRSQITNPIIKQLIQRRIDLQNMPAINGNEQDAYFKQYVECVKQVMQEEKNKKDGVKKKRKISEIESKESHAKRVKVSE